jgi:hypothetical protein
MNPLLVAPAVEVIKELFKFGGSFRKEAITLGAVTPSVISVYNTYVDSCVTECSWITVSGEQWAALIGSLLALTVHLYAKRNETKKLEG